MSITFDSAAAQLFKGGVSPKPVSGDAASSFSSALQGALASVDQTAGAANTAVTDMLEGTGDVHDAMIALQKAQSTLELTIQVRNKLVQAYQDIMRMPV
jgi:flagellar hook-basal body complex protein FliE